jgi:hypothetical protein
MMVEDVVVGPLLLGKLDLTVGLVELPLIEIG